MKIRLPILLVALLFAHVSFSQVDQAFCLAVENANFESAENSIKKQVRNHRRGFEYVNQTTGEKWVSFEYSLDSITLWLRQQPCVEDAFWDKCEVKPAIYPAPYSIGVIFNTKYGKIEKCFQLQGGTIGEVYLLGWKPKLFRPRDILLYNAMYDCEGFIKKQRQNCRIKP